MKEKTINIVCIHSEVQVIIYENIVYEKHNQQLADGMLLWCNGM